MSLFDRGLLYCFLILLSSCGTTSTSSRPSRALADRWVLSGRNPSPPQASLEPREALLEVSYVLAVLDDVYVAKNWVPQEDFLLTRFAVRSLVRGRGRWETRLFCERIDAALRLLPDDRFHASLDGRPCSVIRQERINAGGGVGANVAARTEKAWSISEIETGHGKTPVLSLNRFPALTGSAWEGLDQEWDARLTRAPALIVDLRGNSGGDRGSVERLLARFLGASEANSQRTMRIWNQSLPALAARVNAARRAIREEPENADRRRRWVSLREEYRRRRETPATLEPPMMTENWVEKTFVQGRGGWFEGPIMVLSDRACARECEWFLMRLRRHPRATVIGEPSAGQAQLDEFGLVRLPFSGIEVHVPTVAVLPLEASSWSPKGVPVDVPVAPGQDALQVARGELSP